MSVLFQVRAGNDHLLLLDTSGVVWVLGSGNRGELGRSDAPLESNWQEPTSVKELRDEELKVVDIAAGAWHSVILTGEWILPMHWNTELMAFYFQQMEMCMAGDGIAKAS